jgi:hypothetical protein
MLTEQTLIKLNKRDFFQDTMQLTNQSVRKQRCI